MIVVEVEYDVTFFSLMLVSSVTTITSVSVETVPWNCLRPSLEPLKKFDLLKIFDCGTSQFLVNTTQYYDLHIVM